MVTGIIVAAGKGSRMGAGENKVFLKIFDITVIEHTVNTFLDCDEIDEIVVVTGIDDINRCRKLFERVKKPLKIVQGGSTRQESVYNGIIDSVGDIIAIHDGARPLITPEMIKESVYMCRKYGAAAVGVPVKDTIKLIDEGGFIKETTKRECTYQIQTPQVFKREMIKEAHEKYKDVTATDDCMLAELMGEKIKLVEGSYENIKITTPEDLEVAKTIIKKRMECESDE